MKRRRLSAVLGCAVLLASRAVLAQTGSTETALVDPFDLAVGAAPAVNVAVAGALGSLWSLNENPAGLANVKQTTVGFSHLTWTTQQSATLVGVASGSGASFGIAYVDEGTVPGDLRVSDVGLLGGYGFRLPFSPDFALGLSAQSVQHSIGRERATWVAMNAGVQWDLAPGLATVGGIIENVGSSARVASATEDEPQPTAVTAGFSIRLPPGLLPQGSLQFGADVRKVRFHDVGVNVGGEVWFANTLAARAGWMSEADEGEFTIGAGFRHDAFQMDYAFRDMDTLGTTHRLSVSMGFSAE